MQSVTIDISKEKEALAAGIHHTALTFETLREDSKNENTNKNRGEKDSENVTSQTDDPSAQNAPSARVQEVDSIVVCADDGGNGDGLKKDGKTMSL